MSCILDLVGKLVQPIVDILVQKVVRHVGYIVQYKKNMKELEDEMEILEAKMVENKEKVERANIRNDVVGEKVVKWANTAEKMKCEVKDLVVAKARDENVKCLQFSYSNLFSCYQISKQAEQANVEKKKTVKKMGKVEEANVQNDIMKEEVLEGAQEAKGKNCEVEDSMDAKANDENMKCSKLSCPNIFSRYRMSKQAEKKKVALERHFRDGNIDIVAHRRPPPPELLFTSATGKFMDFDSRKPICENIKDGLATPGVNMVGVYGAGGVGKTTIVEEVCKQLKEKGIFYEVIKGVVSRDVNVREIQGHLADQLCLKFESESEKGRAGELWNRLNNDKDNLVILDDLWQELDLRVIGIPLKDGNKGCKVILTTRDCDVLRRMEVSEYVRVEVLSEDESWNLFKKKVSINFTSAELRLVAESVCKECLGLPVAILAVGGALAGKEHKDSWDDTLNQLQNSSWEEVVGIDKNMYASLRLSYDWLVKEAKSILLLCCLYPEDAEIPINFLLFHCIARRLLDPNKNTVEKARHRISTLVDFLKARSLLLDGKDGEFVKMHDVVRDVVISIAKSDEQYLVKDAIDKWPAELINENLAVVSVRFNKLKEVPNRLVCPQLHTLRIECMDPSFQFPDNFFSGVGELRILELKGIHQLSITSSLANLSELRTLILVDCWLEDISFLNGLKSNLEVLVIESSYIKALPAELGELSHLRVLLLKESDRLEIIPAGVIAKLTSLEELHFPDEFDFCLDLEVVENVSRALLELSSLTRLTGLSVFIPNHIPVPDLCFRNLVNFRLAMGRKFYLEPYSGGKIVQLFDTTYNDIFATLLERAEKLHLCRVKGLKKGILDRKGTGLLEVEHLVIRSCLGLDSLSSISCNQSSSFSKLTLLDVQYCSFKFLFTSSCAKGLQQLRELKVRFCEMLEEIIGIESENDELDQSYHMIHFSKLKVLILRNLPKLISFGPKLETISAEGVSLLKGQPLFSEKVNFPSLETLKIKELPNIAEIWGKQSLPTVSFPRLTYLKIGNCEKLVNVLRANLFTEPQLILEEIQVENCKGSNFSVTIDEEIEAANNRTIIFPRLSMLCLNNLRNLKSFCGYSENFELQPVFKSQVTFPSLERLVISYCFSIAELWDQQVLPTDSFPQLASVEVTGCHKLVNIFPSNMLTMGQNLKKVKVESCPRVEFVVSITGVEECDIANYQTIIFPYLCKAELSHLRSLKSFCGNSSRSDPQPLFEPQVTFPSLEDLGIEGCSRIAEIWEQHVCPADSFPQLASVKVTDCQELVNVFSSNMLTMVQNLKKIKVENCKGIECVVSITGVESETANNQTIIFPYLCEVELADLINLKSFCGNSITYERQHLFRPQVKFLALERLAITGLENITEIWDKQMVPTTSFPRLFEVAVRRCRKLVNVFPSYLWSQCLRSISISCCEGVQVVFSITEEERGCANNCSIIFPQLHSVKLIDLKKLECFCGRSTRSDPLYLFDPQVQFPALEEISLHYLPGIETFREQVLAREVIFPVIWYLECNSVILVY